MDDDVVPEGAYLARALLIVVINMTLILRLALNRKRKAEICQKMRLNW